ncbi:metal-sulfur cluster biosynthetic enzyme [Paenibacillus sp. 2003]|nr:metal-sulfur cluster assembly factor [Paenibacillus sp. 2003]MDR6717784.1 metal-sulfur cluster biosynthetic enzyme [Paenibacillus sp. 2003]
MMEQTTHLLECLKEVYDPELGVNIVDLGLVYEIREEPERVHVRMTLTTPGCPLHDTIVGAVKWVLQENTNKTDIDVQVVWEPQWSPQLMSNEAKEMLGYF